MVYPRSSGVRTVDLGRPSVYQGGLKFKIKHRSRCLQKNKLVDWGGGGRPPLTPALSSIARDFKMEGHIFHIVLRLFFSAELF